MSVEGYRKALEERQVFIYFFTVAVTTVLALIVPGTAAFEIAVNPALAVMLLVTFLQVPLAELRRIASQGRFLAALLVTNFVAIPALLAAFSPLLPPEPMVRFGILLVLLTPCIDYVVTFSHLGRADARLLLAATPLLLVLQILLLPVALRVFLGEDAARLVQIGPFVHAFLWLIAAPLALAAAAQFWAARSRAGERVVTALGLLPVPATALVLFVVIAAVVPQLGAATNAALRVLPIYVGYAVVAPLIGWSCSRLLKLDAPAGRAVAFSAATRNSLVVLPLAFAVPGAVPVLPAVIVTQTLVELVSELVYIRAIPNLGGGGGCS